MVDAEQTYLQKFIDYLVSHYFKTFNKDNCLIANTFQAYLKDEPHRLSKLTNFCKQHNLNLGVKLVRGAYMNEESNFAERYNYPNPICSEIEDTHANYNNSIQYLFDNYKPGDKVIINKLVLYSYS
jgi:proline dehydrogenase